MSQNIIKIGSEQLTKRLRDAFIMGFDLTAGTKTRKYLISNKEDFEKRLDSVIQTIVGLMSTCGSTVTVNNVSYGISEYRIPSRLEHLIKAGRVYASPDAVGKVEPMFEVESAEISLSPVQFNRFFDEFNSYQETDETRIKLVDNWVRGPQTLENIQYLEDENGSMYKLHESGYDIETCYLLGLKIPALSCYLPRYNAPSPTGVALWLFK